MVDGEGVVLFGISPPKGIDKHPKISIWKLELQTANVFVL